MRALSRSSLVVAAFAMAVACHAPGRTEPGRMSSDPFLQQLMMDFGREPDTVATRFRGLIGEYGPDTTHRWIALERDGRMWILGPHDNYVPLGETNDTLFVAPKTTASIAGEVAFHRDSTGRATLFRNADMVIERRNIEPPPGATQLKITPVRPIDELRREALAAKPPAETGSFRPADLVELVKVDTSIRLDIRYATSNNFLGTPLYEEARAFMQRPAAEALKRANKILHGLGYTILVHDAYRPWYVTKIFWDATPEDKKWLVANPAQGSKHNRGAAVDLTLYDIQQKHVAEMPSTYDESSPRAYADYPGGTSLQRYHRALLRRVMEHEGFVANPREWWHFDYKEWNHYPILNLKFEDLPH